MNPTKPRLYIALAAAGLVLAIGFAPPALADNMSPVGDWKTIDDETGKAKSIVRIVEKDGKLYGTIIKLIDPPEPDPVCDECTGDLKGKKIVGMTIMKGLKKDGKKWTDGTILDPENGKTYSCFIEVLPGGKKLKLRGYVGISLLGRTQHWHRVN